jgi:hypothetical protein
MTGIVALSPVFNAMLPDAIQVQQRYDRHCCIEPVSAENPIRHRDQGLSVTDCIDNNVGNPKQ